MGKFLRWHTLVNPVRRLSSFHSICPLLRSYVLQPPFLVVFSLASASKQIQGVFSLSQVSLSSRERETFIESAMPHLVFLSSRTKGLKQCVYGQRGLEDILFKSSFPSSKSKKAANGKDPARSYL